MSIEANRNVSVKLNGQGYKLIIGDQTEIITPREALGLLTSLLHTLPEVPDGVRLSHIIRNGPRLAIWRNWRHENGAIIQDSYTPVISVRGTRVYTGPEAPSVVAAHAIAARDYGKEMEVLNIIDRPGSRLLAEKRASNHLLLAYLDKHKLTPLELMTKINTTGTPEDLNLVPEVIQPSEDL